MTTWRVDYTTPSWQCPDCARGTCEAADVHATSTTTEETR